jgi:hypothetical protein
MTTAEAAVLVGWLVCYLVIWLVTAFTELLRTFLSLKVKKTVFPDVQKNTDFLRPKFL